MLLFAALLISLISNIPAELKSKKIQEIAPDVMSLTANHEETKAFVAAQGVPDLMIFTEDRAHPVRRDDALPQIWLKRSSSEREKFSGKASPGEFTCFQIAVYNATDSAQSVISAEFEMPGVPASNLHCLNFETRPEDEPPLRDGLPLALHSLKTLWMAVLTPPTPTELTGSVKIVCHNTLSGQFRTLSVPIELKVAGILLTDGGMDEAWRLARLGWLLPGDLGAVPEPTHGYAQVRRDGHTLHLTGKQIRLADTGLPEQITSFVSASGTKLTKSKHTLLKVPVRFVVETDHGPETLIPDGNIRFTSEGHDGISWEVRSHSGIFHLECRGRLEFDGSLRYNLSLASDRTVDVRDVRLEVPYRAEAAPYVMGLGIRGGRRPQTLDWKWDISKHQDRIWIGGVNNGAQWQFKGSNYRRPLVNIYYGFRPLALPESWGNEGRGGVTLHETGTETVLLTACCGVRRLKAGETLQFKTEVSLTPSRPIDTDKQWATRFYHPGDGVDTGTGEKYLATMKENGANVLNLHHRQRLNPFINYPFNDFSVPELADFTKRAHAQDIRVKVYYTTRELTQQMPEFFALHRLDGAIIQPGPGPLTRTIIHSNGPNSWLNENLRSDFIPAWYTQLDGKYAGMKDLSVLTRPDGAWNRFYLHGLDWLVRKTDIDGVYIDDTALDRGTMLRARRILESHRPAPLIDLHSWNPFDKDDSYIVSASLYMDLLPFVDRLWLGEAADYGQSPDAWLIQYSGIPYGVMSEMLEGGGGNPWRGMLFGMTGRFGHSGDPRAIWKFWDSFGLQGSEMIGWWDTANPVKTNHSDVLATIYRKPHKTLIVIASWARETTSVALHIDWKSLGLDPSRAVLHAEAISGFQPETKFDLNKPITVEPGKGWLLILE